MSIPPPIPLFDRKRPSLRPDLLSGRAPRAAPVKDAGANAAASAEPAQSVLDRASTVLPLPWRHCIQGVARGYRPALFRLIIGGRSVPSREESANHRFLSPHACDRRIKIQTGEGTGLGGAHAVPKLQPVGGRQQTCDLAVKETWQPSWAVSHWCGRGIRRAVRELGRCQHGRASLLTP